jgi:hypothetical protein
MRCFPHRKLKVLLSRLVRAGGIKAGVRAPAFSISMTINELIIVGSSAVVVVSSVGSAFVNVGVQRRWLQETDRRLQVVEDDVKDIDNRTSKIEGQLSISLSKAAHR